LYLKALIGTDVTLPVLFDKFLAAC
jgi:hypothetical protein